MVVKGVSIILDKEEPQYCPGQDVSGKLLVRIEGEEWTTEISIRFFGNVATHWVETETRQHSYWVSDHSIGGSNRGHMHYYTTYHDYDYDGREIFFDLAMRLFGDGMTQKKIPAGDSYFPFKFQVPARPLPVNCNFVDGKVVYGLEACVRKPGTQFDPRTPVYPLIIYTMVDLNNTPGAGRPFQGMDMIDVGCCCSTEELRVKSFTPKMGFVPGEVVPLVVEISNQTSEDIYSLRASLRQVWTLYANGFRGRHWKEHPVVLQTATHPGVAKGQNIKWELNFRVPPSVPPASASTLVTLEYMLEIMASVPQCCGEKELYIAHPLIVGNVPLKEREAYTPQMPKYEEG